MTRRASPGKTALPAERVAVDADPRVRQRFTAALDSLVAQIKEDRSIVAAVLAGSLSYDAVWDRSDIDLVLVTIDDRKVEAGDLALWADGVNVHALLMPRREFREKLESALRNSFVHSFMARGRLLYSHDPSIDALCASLAAIGERDRRLQLLSAGTCVLPPLNKAHKWMVTRGDADYAALWLLYAATPLAEVEVISAGLLVDREVILQAMQLNPSFFTKVYRDLLNGANTAARVQSALDAADRYLAARAPTIFAAVLDHLREAGEVRSCREIDDHFRRTCGFGGAVTACEYLADQGLVGKASASARLTKRSNVDVQELAFFHLDAPVAP